MKRTGAKNKGWMKNLSTSKLMPFMFNPTELEYERSAEYADIPAPGSPYPFTQYVRGNATEFDVTLFFHDIPYTGAIMPYINFLQGFLPSENPLVVYSEPAEMLFCQGYFIRTCVVKSVKIRVKEFNVDGQPTVAEIILGLRQVGL